MANQAITIATFVLAVSHVAVAATTDGNEPAAGTRKADGDSDDSEEYPGIEATRANSSPANSSLATQSVWYGESIMFVDLAALGLAALSFGLANGNATSRDLAYPSGLAALTVYASGGPIIHAYHHNYGDAGTSIALRLGLPLGGALLGLAAGLGSAGSCNGETCGLGNGMSATAGGVIGFAGGMIVASAIDIGGFAYEESVTQERPRMALVPSVDARNRGAGLNLVGLW